MPSSTMSRLAAGKLGARARSGPRRPAPPPGACDARAPPARARRGHGRGRRRRPRDWCRPPCRPARIAASKAASGIGSLPEPASAPSSTALITPPLSSAAWSMSNRICCLAALLHRAQQPADIEAAVAHRRALADRQHAMRRGDQGRAVGRDEAVEDHAAGFQQLGRQRHVDLADRRIERQHRRRAARAPASPRDSRSWRRCAAPRRGSASPARPAPGCARRRRSSRTARRRRRRPARRPGW